MNTRPAGSRSSSRCPGGKRGNASTARSSTTAAVPSRVAATTASRPPYSRVNRSRSVSRSVSRSPPLRHRPVRRRAAGVIPHPTPRPPSLPARAPSLPPAFR